MEPHRKDVPVLNRVADAAAPGKASEGVAESATTDTEIRTSWRVSVLLVLPGLAVMLAGLAMGLQSVVGILLTSLGVAYLVLEALYLQPRFAFRLPGLELERVALKFAHNRIRSRTLAELADNFQTALRDGLGIPDVIIILQGSEGQLSFGGDVTDLKAVRRRPLVVSLLKRHGGLTTRDTLSQDTGERAESALSLLNELEADVFLSFSQDRQLLGFAIFNFPWKNSEYAEAFLEVVGESMTSGLISQYLRHQAGGREAMAQVFALAHAMQASLLPAPELVEIDSVQLQGWSEPAEQCGGDLWAWHDLGEGQVLFFVGDVTGHGVSPATLASAVSGALAAHASLEGRRIEPALLLYDLNNLVREVGRKHHTMSAFAAVFNPRACEVRFANAGHNPPLLLRESAGFELTSLRVEGSMLGSADELEFRTVGKKLQNGDMLFLFSDGIVEAGEPHMPRFGFREFRKSLIECASLNVSDACKHIRARVQTHLGDTDAGDDMTFVALHFSDRFEETR